MNTTKANADIWAIRASALDELMATTDDDLRREAREDGDDLNVLAFTMKADMREVAASVMRERLVRTRAKALPEPPARAPKIIRPAIDRIKELVQDIFSRDKSLGLAFRDGKRQSDADWQSLYDDLVAMGAIREDGDGI